MLTIYMLRKNNGIHAILRLGKKGGRGGGGSDFTWEPLESALSKITKYFPFCIFIVVKK